MSQFKVGDLALVKQCADAPEMVGKCVELVEFIPAGTDHFEYGFTPVSAWIVSGEGLVVNTNYGLMPSEFTGFGEHLLMPLRGDFTPEEVREMEKEHA